MNPVEPIIRVRKLHRGGRWSAHWWNAQGMFVMRVYDTHQQALDRAITEANRRHRIRFAATTFPLAA